MADIFNDIINLTDDSDFLTDAKLQTIAKNILWRKYGHLSRTIHTGDYAPTATTLWLKIDDTDEVAVDGSGNSIQTFGVLYWDYSNPSDKKYFHWEELTAEDPGDGSLALHLLNDTSLTAQSHTLGSGAGEFDLSSDPTVTYFRILFNDALPVSVSGGSLAQLVFPPSAAQSISAGTTITVASRAVQVNGNGGAVTVTATPTVAAGAQVGQKLIIIGGANAVTVQDDATLDGSNLQLKAHQRAIGQGDQLELRWMDDGGGNTWWAEDHFQEFVTA